MIISARVRAFGRCSSSSIWKRSIPLTRRSVSLRSLARSHCYNNSIGIVRHSSASQLLSLRGIHHHRSTPISKVCSDAKTALELSGLKNGDTVAVGGFGTGGTPETLLNELSRIGPGNLTIASLTAGIDSYGLGKLYESGKVKRMIGSYVGENKNFERMFFTGELEGEFIASVRFFLLAMYRISLTDQSVELVPQGTIAARLRAAGSGMPAIFTPAGAGTMYADGGIPLKYSADGSVKVVTEPRPTQVFDGKEYVMEYALRPEVSLVKAYKADTRGNLVFRGTSQNANPDCAVAGKIVLAEAETIVEAGELNPDEIHCSGVYVDHLILATDNEKRIERLREWNASDLEATGPRVIIAKRAAREFKDGMYVNLGIGIPTMSSNYIPEGVHIQLQAENGLMGLGAYPNPSLGQVGDNDFINASKETVTSIPGASSFSSSESFSMIRGGHIDLTILGGMEVSSSGDLASFFIPGKLLKGMGGAMDLVSSPSTVIVTMEHTARNGSPKILKKCNLPLTGKAVVDKIITEMCVFECDKRGLNKGGLTLIELASGVTVDDVRAATDCEFDIVDGEIPLMKG